MGNTAGASKTKFRGSGQTRRSYEGARRRRRVVAVLVLASVILVPLLTILGGSARASTQGGILDTTWPNPAYDRGVNATLVAPDGKIWVADDIQTRAYDTSSGAQVVSNKRETSSTPYSLATQVTTSGTYILSGQTNGIFRYLASDGTKDTTFATGQTGTNRALLVQGTGSSQKIFAAASNDLKRYSANGALESTTALGSQGNALALQTISGTEYVLVGGVFGLKRYSIGSVLDSSFTANPGGTVNAIKVQSDGKILVAGTFGLKRYNADGSADATFPSITTSMLSLEVQSDGKIVAGTSSALLRYSSAGVAETTFNTNAALNGSFNATSISLESSGRIIVGGSSNVSTKKFLRRYSWENVAPGMPPAPTAVSGNGSATVTVAAGTGATPTNYAVYVVGDPSKTCSVTGASGSCTISGLLNGTSYQFYTVAYNVDAASPDSPSSTAVTPADTTRPTYTSGSAALDAAGTTITLTYNEALASTTALTSAFTVSAGGTNFPVSSVTVSGSTVSLGLSSVIGKGLTVTVSYAAPTSDAAPSNAAIQDIAGNDALSLSSQSVSNGSLIDTTRPTYVSSAVDSTGTVLTLTYSEALNATTAPASAFTVLVGGVQREVTGVVVSGSTVQLTLASPVGAGSPSTVTVAYAAPSDDSTAGNAAIQDTTGNDALTLTARAITTNSSTVDLTPPTISSRAINTAGTIVTLTYSEALNTTTAPASAFSVMVDGVQRDVDGVEVSGTTVRLTLASPVGAGQSLTVAYSAPDVNSTPSNAAVQDTAGNDAASFAATSFTNSSTVDQTAPTLSTRAINTAGTVLTLTYNEALNSTTAPTSAFTVLVGGVERAVSEVVVSGTKVELTLASVVEKNQTVTVAYTAPTPNSTTSNNAVQDTAGNDAISFTASAVTNSSTVDLTAPTFVSAAVNAAGTVLSLTYNETLHATTAATTAFTVMVDGVARSVSSVAVSGLNVNLTLASAITGGQSVTVEYVAPAVNTATTNTAIQDSAGNDAVSLSTTVVTNGSTEGPPIVSSAEVLTNGTQLRVNWNETLGSSYPPHTSFTVMVNGVQVLTTGMNTVSPSNYFTLNLASSVKAGQTVTISYAAPTSDPATNNQAVQDTGGRDADSFTNYPVTNNSTLVADTTAPTLVSASVNTAGTVLTLAYNETLSTTTAQTGDFVVKVNGTDYLVSSVAVSGSNVLLTISPAIQAGQTVTVTYTAPTPDSWGTNRAIQDSSGNDALLLTNQSVTNNSTAGPDIAPPTLNTVTASGTTVTLAFNEPLASALPPLSAFTVFVGGTAVVPTAVTISGSNVVLTMPTAVSSGTEVQVSYVAPTPSTSTTNLAIQDLAGNDALSFSGTTQPHSTTWDWKTPYDATTNATPTSRCIGGGSINREKFTTLPNGVQYSVAVEGEMTCINDVTESLYERGGREGMFVATGLVTEPGLKLTTSNDGCLANVVCPGRGFLTLKFSQPVTDPVFSFAGWGGAADGRSWVELRLITGGITLTKLSGTNIAITEDGKYIEDNGQSNTTSCNTNTAGSSAVCGSVQINGTVTSVEFEIFMQTSGGTGNEDAWNLTASMAEDFGLVPTTYEAAGVASHGVGNLKLGLTVAADNVSSLYSTTNGDAVPRWTSLDNHPKEDDGVATWKDSPTVAVASGGSYSITVSLSGVTRTAYLCAWIDFNRDETFAYGERVCSAPLAVGATSATLTWTVPADVQSGLTYARVRLSHDGITLPTGKLGSGEVEDYSFVISSDALPFAVNDVSTGGQGVTQTLSPLTNDLFEAGYPVNTSTLRLCGSLEIPAACTQTTLTVTGEGTYTVNTSTGVVTFVPLPTFTGTATSIRYQITDTQATPETTSAIITVTVYPPPTATADATSGQLNITQTVDPLLNDSYGDSRAPLDATSVQLCGTSPVQTPPNCTQTTVSVTGGTYSVNTSTGVITFTPTTGFVGTAPSVTYQVEDSIDQVASSTYTPTVIASAAGVDDESSGAWNVDQIISPLTNDTTPTGYALGSLKLCGTSPVETSPNCSQPELTVAGQGTYTVNADGTVTFDPLPTFTGIATPIDYQAQNSLGQVVDATITVTVLPPPAPVANPNTSEGLLNVAQAVNVLTNDTTFDPAITLVTSTIRLCDTGETAPNCTKLTVSVSGGVYSVDTTTGVITFTPTTGFVGSAPPVTYQVTDSTGQTASSTYSPLVIAQPVATDDASSGSWNVNQTISPITSDTPAAGHPLGALKLCDPSSDPVETSPNCTLTELTVSGVGTYTVNADGTVTFDPLPTFTSVASVTYQVVDDLGQYASALLTYTVTPPPPPTAEDDLSNGFLNVNQTINPLANDDTHDPLIGLDETSVQLCAITPTAQIPPNCTATSVTVVGGTYSVDVLTGLITFTPETGWSGTAPSVTYQVSDDTRQVASAAYSATVYPKPEGVADTSEGDWDENQVISPLANDTFTGSTPAVLSSLRLCDPYITSPRTAPETSPNCTLTTLTVVGVGTYTVNTTTGEVTFNPESPFYDSSNTITYQAVDTLGQYVTSTITVEVGSPPPPAASDETKSTLQGQSVSFTTITGTSGLASGTGLQTSGPGATCLIDLATDKCDSDNVVVISGEGTYTLDPATGIVTYTADPDATSGTKTPIAYQVTDALGRTDTGVLTPVVAPVPTATADTSTGNWDTSQTITPLVNDAPGAPSAPLVVASLRLCDPYITSPRTAPETSPNCTLTELSVAGQGTYTLNGDGTVTFVPLSTFTGTATPVTYQVSDSLGQVASATITVTVRTPPQAVSDTSTGAYDTNQTITPLSNDTVGSGDLSTATLLLCSTDETVPNCTETSLSVPGEGTYTVNTTTGVVTFDPLPTFTGLATPVTYQVSDAFDQVTSSTITPTVGLPPAPSASPDTSSGAYDTNQTITPLSNDREGNSYFPLDATTVKLCLASQDVPNCTATTLTVADEGTYTVNTTTGEVTFNPLPTFTGTATPVTYQVKDSLNRVVSSTITPTVDAPPLTMVNDTSSGAYDTNQTVAPLVNDVPGAPWVATSVKLCASGQTVPSCTSMTLTVPGEGTYTVNDDGTVTFDPLPTFTGDATPVTYQATDVLNRTDSATITTTVGLPPAPTALPDTSSGLYDTNQTISPLSNDAGGNSYFPLDATSVKLCDPSTSPPQTAPNCTRTSLTIAGQGTYTVNDDGTVTFDPLPSFTGTAAPVTYQVKDSLNRVVSSTITPTVGLPPAPSASPDTSSGAYDTNQTITPLDNDREGNSYFPLDATSVRLCSDSQDVPNCTSTSVTVPGEGTYTVNSTTGAVTFNPLPTFTGEATPITYQVEDSLDRVVTSTITPTVGPPPAPSASPNTSSGAYDTNQIISPLNNDAGGNSYFPLDVTTVKLCAAGETSPNCTRTSLTIAGEGTYTVNTDGTVIFDPLPTFSGTATPIAYQVKDSLNRAVSSTITVTVVAPPLTMVNDTSSGAYDTNQTVAPLVNDVPGAPWVATSVKLCDPSTSPPQTAPNCTRTSLTIAGQGTYTVNDDGTVTFNPLPTFTGVATAITYQATDVLNRTASATITVTVLAPPPPLANPDTVSLIAGGTETFTNIFGTDGLARKQEGGPELVPATVCLIDPATNVCDINNEVVIAGQGTFILDPATGIVTYESLDSATSGTKTAVQYSITDTLGVSATATLTPTIYPKPTALPDSSVGVMGVVQTLSPFGNDSPGTASHPLVRGSIKLCGETETSPNCTKTSVTVDGEGTYTVTADGTVQFAPISTFVGTATPLSYTVTDTLGQEATSTLNPRVVPPPAPITQVDTGTAEQGSTVVLSPWLNDDPGTVPAGVEGEVELVSTSIRLCGPTDTAPNCTRTTLTTDDGTYTVDVTTGKVTFVHKTGFIGTVTQPVTYVIANDWTGESGIGYATNILIPTIVPRVTTTTTSTTVYVPTATTTPGSESTTPTPTTTTTTTVPKSEAPRAFDDSITSNWDSTQRYTPTANDSFPGSEPDPATVRLCALGETPYICTQTTVIVPNEGTYVVNSDGTVTFDPVPSFFGTATPMTYQVMDRAGRYVSANIIPIVLPPEDKPQVFDQSATTRPQTPQWLTPTLRGIASRGAVFDQSTLSIWSNARAGWTKSVVTPHGRWRVIEGRVRFMPHAGFVGTTYLPYSVKDSHGVQLNAVLSVTVEDSEVMPATGTEPPVLLLLAILIILIGIVLSMRARIISRRGRAHRP